MIKKVALSSLCLNLLFSSPIIDGENMEDIFEEAKTKCLEKSELKSSKLMAEPIDFPKDIVVILKGKYQQKFRKGVSAIEICLYDKKSRDIEIKEAFDITACSISERKDQKFFNYKKYSEDITISVEEGENEPKCSGSYSIKAYFYEVENGEFISGISKLRDGAIKNIKIEDIDNDNKKEIIVTLSTSGSGKYYSVDVFKFIDNKLIFDKILSIKMSEEANINN